MATREELQSQYGQVWDEVQLEKDFETLGIVVSGKSDPPTTTYTVVRRKDQLQGTITVQDQPKLFYEFVPFPHLIAFSVEKLFGQYDHSITFDSGGVALLHGPNGVGKTTLLELLVAARALDIGELEQYPFYELNLTYSDTTKLTITKRLPDAERIKELSKDWFDRQGHAQGRELRGPDGEVVGYEDGSDWNDDRILWEWCVLHRIHSAFPGFPKKRFTHLEDFKLDELVLEDLVGWLNKGIQAKELVYHDWAITVTRPKADPLEWPKYKAATSTAPVYFLIDKDWQHKVAAELVDRVVRLREISVSGPEERFWENTNTGEILGAVPLINRFYYDPETGNPRNEVDAHQIIPREFRTASGGDYLFELRSALPDQEIHLIESHRLNQSDHLKSVDFLALRMTERLDPVIEEAKASDLESTSTFVQRAFGHRDVGPSKDGDVLVYDHSVPDDEWPQVVKDCFAELKELRDRWNRIRQTGIIPDVEMVDFSPIGLVGAEIDLLSLWIEDKRESLVPYMRILDKLELFLNIINRRFEYSGKHLRCDTKSGFQVKAADDRTIPLQRLSSGEQNLIVMVYRLVFDISAGSLVLIDEPEISLHVEWQREFVNEIKQIAEHTHHTFLIATHSPQIIDDNWGQTQQLGQSVDNLADGEDE